MLEEWKGEREVEGHARGQISDVAPASFVRKSVVACLLAGGGENF